MKFEGKPFSTVNVMRKTQFFLKMKIYAVVRFDEKGIADVTDEYVIERLKASGYKVIKERTKTAEKPNLTAEKPKTTAKRKSK